MDHIGVGTFTSTPLMHEYINQIMANNRLSYGPFSQRFEREFAAMHQSAHGILSNSGTSSLHVALQAMKELYGWQDGDEIIVPAVTFVATTNVILHNNLIPVLVDVDPVFYEIHPGSIHDAVTSKTRAIMPVHLFGQPCDMTYILQIAMFYGLKIIEDSCECMGVDHAGRRVGSWGDVACFSFYVAHLLSTGVGGMGITNDPILAAKMRSLVNHGRDGIYISIDDGRDATGDDLKEVISKRFRFESQGHSFRITEFEAALGCAQMGDLELMIQKRQANAAYLTKMLTPLQDYIQLPAIRPETGHAFMMYPIVLHAESKVGLTTHLEELGIETREMLPLTNQPVYTGRFDENTYPVAQWINESGFYVGIHQDLTADDLNRIVDGIKSYYEKRTA